MKKAILILLLTIFCSNLSFAQKKEFFKQSEMTSKKITTESIYYAFIEGYFKRVESYDINDDINDDIVQVDSMVEAGAQFQQMVNVECITDFKTLPDLNLTFNYNGVQQQVCYWFLAHCMVNDRSTVTPHKYWNQIINSG